MKNYWLVFILILPLSTWGQEHPSEHPEDHLEKGIIEIISTGNSIFPIGEGSQLFGSELHLTYWFDHVYGTGFSYTAKFEEGGNTNDLALLASWNPTQWMTINLGPNLAFPNEHRELALLAYAEAEINWRLRRWFHLGPVVGTLLGRHSEWTLGFHLGFEFGGPWSR